MSMSVVTCITVFGCQEAAGNPKMLFLLHVVKILPTYPALLMAVIHNIKGTYHRELVWGPSTLFFLAL